MKAQLFFACTLLSGVTLLSTGFSDKPIEQPSTAAKLPPGQALIKRGEYLVTVMGCGDCHSPKAMGPQGPEPVAGKALSGYPADRPLPKPNADALKEWVLFNGDNTASAGPWGISFAANLTSNATGIGNWTRDQFKRALTQGKSKGIATNRMLLPPMPWPNYRTIEDADLDAIFAYLKSTKPVANVVPVPVPPGR